MGEYAELQANRSLDQHLFEGRRRGRGYYRERPKPITPVSFELEGHRFETEHRDLWVTLPGQDRIDRIKVTRSSVSRSVTRESYPPELVWPRVDRQIPLEQIKAAARFWLGWSRTDDYKRFNPVGLDQWQRSVELKNRRPAA